MPLKNLFRRKQASEQELRDELREAGIMTSTSGRKQEHFGQIRFSSQRNDSNPYSSMNTSWSSSTNPYTQSSSLFTNTSRGNSYTYGSVANNQSITTSKSGYTPSAARSYSDPYGIHTSRTTVSLPSRSGKYREQHFVDLNVLPTEMSKLRKKKVSTRRPPKCEIPDLNSVSEGGEDYSNEDPNSFEAQAEEELDPEEKEIRQAKQDIKFLRQESLLSIRIL